MADGFAEPGRLHILRMVVGEIDAAHEMIALPYHPDLVRRLDEIHGLEKKELGRHTPRPAARLGGKGNHQLATQHLFVRCQHMLRGPRFQYRILIINARGPVNYTSTSTTKLIFEG